MWKWTSVKYEKLRVLEGREDLKSCEWDGTHYSFLAADILCINVKYPHILSI